MSAWYNEIDPYAAQWLRNLIEAGHLPAGDVDERDIRDVRPDELAGYTQCHFFAGIGGWPLALRQAGWSDDRAIWTGSCPCQPFSAAGKGVGFTDERHLWPAWFHLISQCAPEIILGEQVASKDALTWLDLVQSDLEAAGFAFAATDLCAAGVGAPHIRQRLWFVAHASAQRQQQHEERHGQSLAGIGASRGDDAGRRGGSSELADAAGVVTERHAGQRAGSTAAQGRGPSGGPAGRRDPGGLGNGLGARLEGHAGHGDGTRGWPLAAGPTAAAGEPRELGDASREPDEQQPGGLSGPQGTGTGRGGDGSWGTGPLVELADADGRDAGAERQQRGGQQRQLATDGGSVVLEHTSSSGRQWGQAPAPGHDDDRPAPEWSQGQHGAGLAGPHRVSEDRAGPVNGFWRVADWLLCRDGKWRPVEPGTFPLAHGIPARVGRLRAYGNAICTPLATQFIEAVMEIQE